MTIRELDTLLAIKALLLAPDLLDTDRRVAAAIVEHFNRKTLRCDPSIGRIARLVEVSTRTVMRSMKRLEQRGLISRTRHGGYSNRNSYAPNWNKLSEIGRVWQTRFTDSARAQSRSGTDLSRMQRQPSHSTADAGVTQTCSRNLLNKTFEATKGVTGAMAQVSVATMPATGRTDAAQAEALRRWTTELHLEFSELAVTYGEIIDKITPEIEQAATSAEMRRRGAGLEYVGSILKLGPVRRRGAFRSPDLPALPRCSAGEER